MTRAIPVTVFGLAMAVLAGCAETRSRADVAEFGPGVAQQIEHLEQAESAKDQKRVPPAYARAAVAAAGKATVTRRTRADGGDPAEQNWEVALEVVRADAARADGDELLAAWMTGRGGPNTFTTTGMRFARSTNGAQGFNSIDVQIPEVARHIPFDPSVVYGAVDGKVYIGAVGQEVAGGRRLWVSTSIGADSAQFAPGALLPPPPQGSINDKVWLAAGRAPDNAAQGILYAIDRTGAMASVDRGASWSATVRPQSLSNLPQPLVFPDGTLALTYYGATHQALFARSTDRARTFSAPVPIHTFAGSFSELTGGALPGGYRAPPTTVFTRSPVDGRLFAVLSDVTRRSGTEADIDVLLFESGDGGNTWSNGRNLTAGAPADSDQFAPWIAVDATGQLHVAYFDTRRAGGGDAAANAAVDVWYALSTDNGASWTSTRLTDPPIPSERTRWSPLSDAPGGQFIGDYFTIATSRHAAYVAHPVFEAETIGMAVSRIDFEPKGTTPIRDLRGLTGGWFDPATSGQGFEFQWVAGDVFVVTFYGHRDNAANLFLVGLRAGRFGYGEQIDIPLVVTTGGRFNHLDPNAIQRAPWGSLRLTFNSCAGATAVLSGTDGTQTLNLQRVALAPDLPCD